MSGAFREAPNHSTTLHLQVSTFRLGTMLSTGYLHRNSVKRGLVKEPGDWEWSSFRHYALRENGVGEIESEWTARDRELKMFGGPARTFLSPGYRPKDGREPGAPGLLYSGHVRLDNFSNVTRG